MLPSLLKLAIYIAVIAMLTMGLWSKSEVIQQIAACLFLALEAASLVALSPAQDSLRAIKIISALESHSALPAEFK